MCVCAPFHLCVLVHFLHLCHVLINNRVIINHKSDIVFLFIRLVLISHESKCISFYRISSICTAVAWTLSLTAFGELVRFEQLNVNVIGATHCINTKFVIVWCFPFGIWIMLRDFAFSCVSSARCLSHRVCVFCWVIICQANTQQRQFCVCICLVACYVNQNAHQNPDTHTPATKLNSLHIVHQISQHPNNASTKTLSMCTISENAQHIAKKKKNIIKNGTIR